MQIESKGQNGVYQVTGQTNLPEQTQLKIQAIRNLQPPDRDSQAEPNYAILAQTQVRVEHGKWQTSLNLLQPSDAGNLESWQQSVRSLNLNLNPENRVRFLAVTTPTERSIELQSRSNAIDQATSVQFTADGKSYLQAEQFLTIEPPNTKVATRREVPQAVVKVAVQPMNKTIDVKQTNAQLPNRGWMR